MKNRLACLRNGEGRMEMAFRSLGSNSKRNSKNLFLKKFGCCLTKVFRRKLVLKLTQFQSHKSVQ
jgi:hypothetical protein